MDNKVRVRKLDIVRAIFKVESDIAKRKKRNPSQDSNRVLEPGFAPGFLPWEGSELNYYFTLTLVLRERDADRSATVTAVLLVCCKRPR